MNTKPFFCLLSIRVANVPIILRVTDGTSLIIPRRDRAAKSDSFTDKSESLVGTRQVRVKN